MSPEMQIKIQDWRAKARAGTLTQDEMREAMAALREDRVAAAATSAKSRAAKPGKAVVSSEDLLAELDGL